MSYLKCSKHGTDLECMGGCSAHPDNWYCPKCDAEEALREEYAAERKKEYEKEFNAYCATVMKFEKVAGNNNEPLYYDNDEIYVGLVKDYTPYDDPQLLYVIAAELTKQLGVSVGFREEEEKGALVAYRDFILSTIVAEDKETIIVGADDEKINFESMGGEPTNINWQAGRILVLANYRGYTSFYSGCTDEYFLARYPDNSDGIESIEISSFNVNGLSQSDAIEGYIRDPQNGLELWEAASRKVIKNDTRDRGNTAIAQSLRISIIQECLKIMASEYMSDQDKFNDRCRNIVRAYGEPCTFVDEYNPHDNMNQLVDVVEIVIKEGGKDFLVSSDARVSLVEEMRAYVKWYGSEEYINLD